jgi:hypothetical protein
MWRKQTTEEFEAIDLGRKDRPTPWLAIVIFTLLGLAAIAAALAVGFNLDDCSSRGGTMVRTFGGGYTCVKLQPIDTGRP